MPDRETVRPNLERTDSPALVPSGFRFSPEQPGFGAFPLCPSDISPASGGNPKVVRGRASAVWLAFVGGASVCPASEPCSYNGLNDRVSAAFRPSLQTSLTTCGGHRRRVVCWRPRAAPLAACLPYSVVFFLPRVRRLRVPRARRCFVFRAPTRWPLDRRLLFILLHMWWESS